MKMPIKGNQSIFSHVELIAGAFTISFSAVFVKLVSAGPVAIGFYRMVFGGSVLLLIACIKKEKILPGIKPILLSLLAGFFFAMDLTFWHRSIQYIGPGLATILANFQVIFLAVIGILFFKERITMRFIFSIPLAMTGILLLCGLNWSSLPPDYKTGIFLGLITALCYTAFILTLRFLQTGSDAPSTLTTMVMISLLSSMILGIEGMIFDEKISIINIKDLFFLISYGVLSQGLGWMLITHALPHVSASRTGLILLLQPAFAMVWDIIFFNRESGAFEMAGAGLAITAIYLGTTGERIEMRESEYQV